MGQYSQCVLGPLCNLIWVNFGEQGSSETKVARCSRRRGGSEQK